MLDLDLGADDAYEVHRVTVFLTPRDLRRPRERHLGAEIVLLLVVVIHRAFEAQAPTGR